MQHPIRLALLATAMAASAAVSATTPLPTTMPGLNPSVQPDVQTSPQVNCDATHFYKLEDYIVCDKAKWDKRSSENKPQRAHLKQ